MKKYLIITILLLVFCCSKDFESYYTNLNGYWEISRVEQNNKVFREFTVSPVIDYWQIEADRTGFRKKVMPNLEGKITITQHRIPFTIKIEDNNFNIYYNDKGVEHKETVTKVTSEELIITNDDGMTYIYKPYEPINLDHD